MTADEFVKRFLSLAFLIEKESGIFAEAILVQSALETGWGTKVKANNYFGIKGKKVLIRTKEVSTNPDLKFQEIYSVKPFFKNGVWHYLYDCKTWFNGYDSAIDSFRDYARFIKENKRYSKALEQDNAADYLREVARAGYATSLNYEETLLNVLESVKKRIRKSEIKVTTA